MTRKRTPKERRGRKERQLRRQAEFRRTPVPPGYKLIPHGASDMGACRCTTHLVNGIPARPIAWRVHHLMSGGRRYQILCLVCGSRWSRSADKRRMSNLEVDASHPEERADREARSARLARLHDQLERKH